MLILMGSRGGIGWDNTQFFFRANWDVIVRAAGLEQTTPSNYGATGAHAGRWHTFRCKACTRVLPTDLAHVDHIGPRSLISYRVEAYNDDHWPPKASFAKVGSAYTIQSMGSISVVPIASGQIEIWTYEVVMPATAFNANGKRRSAYQPVPSRTTRSGTKDIITVLHGVREIKMTSPTNQTVTKPLQEVLENDLANLQLLCSYCNVAKGNRDNWMLGQPLIHY